MNSSASSYYACEKITKDTPSSVGVWANWKIVKDREACCAAVPEVTKVGYDRVTEQQKDLMNSNIPTEWIFINIRHLAQALRYSK